MNWETAKLSIYAYIWNQTLQVFQKFWILTQNGIIIESWSCSRSDPSWSKINLCPHIQNWPTMVLMFWVWELINWGFNRTFMVSQTNVVTTAENDIFQRCKFGCCLQKWWMWSRGGGKNRNFVHLEPWEGSCGIAGGAIRMWQWSTQTRNWVAMSQHLN